MPRNILSSTSDSTELFYYLVTLENAVFSQSHAYILTWVIHLSDIMVAQGAGGGSSKILIILVSFSIITFLHLLNYGVLHFPPPVNNPRVDSSMHSVILLL